MFPTIVRNDKPLSDTAFSDPVMNVTFVMITSSLETPDSLLDKPIRIALPAGHILANDLKQRYPQAIWVNAETASKAMAMVEEGNVDAAIATELSARFMIDHYYQKNMHFFRLPDMHGASVSFAVSSHQPMLSSVMDKALQAIPPREILQMTEKWSKISNTQVDIWSRFSKQFYQLVIFALVLIAISLIWGLSLSREVRKESSRSDYWKNNFILKRYYPLNWRPKRIKPLRQPEPKAAFLRA